MGVAQSDPASALVPWYRRTGAWIGIGTGPGALMAGAGMAGEVGPSLAIPAVIAGCIVLYLLSVAHGLVAVADRKPMGRIVGDVFGPGLGSWILTGTVVVAMLGWCGFYNGIGGAALSGLLSGPQVVGSVLLGGITLGLSLLGQERWNLLIYATAACAVALTVFTVIAVPANPPREIADVGPLEGFIAALGGMIAYAVVFTMRAPDFTIDVDRRLGVWLAGLTMLLPLVALALLGVALYGRTGLFDLVEVLALTERPQAGQVFLMLSTIAPTVTAIYSCAISIESLVEAPHRLAMGGIAALAVSLGATRFDLRLIGFLQALGSVMPPALTIMLLSRRLKRRPPPPHPLLAWGMGSITALAVGAVSPFGGFLLGCCTTAIWLGCAARFKSSRG